MISDFVAHLRAFLKDAGAGSELLLSTSEAFDLLFLGRPRMFEHWRLSDCDVKDSFVEDLMFTFPFLTSGAERLLRGQKALHASIAVILSDKEFRLQLRLEGDLRGKANMANRIIRESRDLAETLGNYSRMPVLLPPSMPSDPTRRAASEKKPKKPTSVADKPHTSRHLLPLMALTKELDTGAAPSAWRITHDHERRLLAAYPGLMHVMGEEFLVGEQKGVDPGFTTLFEVMNALRLGEDLDWIRAALKGVGQSDCKLALLVLFEAVRKGIVSVHPSAAWIFWSTALSLYMQCNAYETAHGLIEETQAKQSEMLAELSDGETVRFQLMRARAALRSGRTDLAKSQSRDVFVRFPGRRDVFMAYLTSIYTQDKHTALDLAEGALIDQYPFTPGDLTFLGDLFLSGQRPAQATAAFLRSMKSAGNADGHIGLANVFLARGATDSWLQSLQAAGSLSGLRIKGIVNGDRPVPFSFAASPDAIEVHNPKVAVVMTSFNSEATIEMAMRSVLGQTTRNLELHVIDDCSTDASREVIKRMAAEDQRVVPWFNRDNMGTYASKNQAIRATDADFVTFHDSDDWMHPSRIKTHLAAMQDNVMCSTSQWMRMAENGHVFVRSGGGYLHLNPASTFVRRQAFEQIGPFDNVRTGADAEFLLRMTQNYGSKGVKRLTTCLSIGLHHDASLTQAGVAAFDEHRFSAVRLAYTESWLRWHLSSVELGQSLAIAGEGRQFQAPPEILSEIVRVAEFG